MNEEEIAAFLKNGGLKRRGRGRKTEAAGGNPRARTDSSEPVCGIRLTGSQFHFYALQVSSEIHAAMKHQAVAASPTTMRMFTFKKQLYSKNL